MFTQEECIKSLNYSLKAYEGQKTFYSNKLMSVALEVIHACNESKYDKEKADFSIVCAILHNIINETKVSYDDLYSDFSPEIAEAIESLSFYDTLQESLDKLLAQPYEVQMVKLAMLIVELSFYFEELSEDEKSKCIKESKFILSCLKNSNIYLSKRLEDKIKDLTKK